MKLTQYLIFLCLVLALQAKAQEINIKMYGERHDDVVRLAWVPKSWPSNMDGVIIKRRSGSESWRLVTSNTVTPSSYVGKDLSNVEPLVKEQERLNSKLSEMVANGKAKPMSAEEYFENILQNPKRISGISIVFAIDYDLMLLNGFGCTDRENISGKGYEYGLFPVISGKTAIEPVTIYNSPPADNPDFSLDVDASVEVIGNNKQLRLHWRFSLDEFRKKEIKGFNIYAKKNNNSWVQINDKIIWITSNNSPANLNYLTEFSDINIDYYAVPVSYFGTEGEGYKLPFNPSIYKVNIPAPKLSYRLDQQTLILRWQLDHGYDSLIHHVNIMKKQPGEDYKLITSLDPSTRNYLQEIPVDGEKGRFKIIIEAQTGRSIWSNEVIINYTPVLDIPRPENLTGEIIKNEDTYFIKLIWQYPKESSETSFRIFTDGPRGNLIYDSSYPPDLKSPFEIEVKRVRGELKHFAIQAVDHNNNKSTPSNTIEIITPTSILPPIYIVDAEINNQDVDLSWEFSNEIVDLKGFSISIDGKVILTENQIDPKKRTASISGIEPGKHSILITAITKYGLQRSTKKKIISIP